MSLPQSDLERYNQPVPMMQQILLQSMTLKNFKGIKSFNLNIDGKNANVFGDNATGKTSLYDAFLWLLFSKDSSNRTDFSVKTHDRQGNEIHGLEHEVEAMLSVRGQPVKLRKQLTEKWTKKRGEADKAFTGHETAYWVDEVPTTKNEYTQRINQFIEEGIFKLLTNPFFFNQQLNWQERRKILLEISGDVSDINVIRSDAKLAKLEGILGGKSTDDYKKVIAERVKKLNQDIEKIPVRIDELTATLAGDDVDYSAAEASLRHFKDQLAAIEAELASAGNAANTFHKMQQKLFKLQTDIDGRKRVLDEQANFGFKRIIDEKSSLLNEKYRLEQEEKSFSSRLSSLTQNIADIAKDMAALRERWHAENIKVFSSPDINHFVCPTCKRALPMEDIDQKILDLQANFDNTKADTLALINEHGKSLKAKKDSTESEATVTNEKLFELQAKRQEVIDRLTEIEQELTASNQNTADYESDTQYLQLQADYQVLKAQMEKPVEDTSTELLQQKRQVTDQIEQINWVLNNRQVAEKTRARIDDLKAEERQLAAQMSELEGHRYLIEQFIKTKVNLLEDSINSRFRTVKFKLFDVQINGAVVECCETLVNTNGASVPFTDVNHAGQINAGIDIISTLSAHYGVSCPIWVDNAEAVNELAEAPGQVIRLVVSQDKELRVEVA